MTNNTEKLEGSNIKEALYKYLIYWRWILVCCILTFLFSFIYLRYQTNVYVVDASIMIKDNQQSGISQDLAVFSDLGILGGASANNPENEIEIIKSRKIISLVVDSLILNVSYSKKGIIKNTEIFKSIPFEVKPLNKNFYEKLLDSTVTLELVNNNNFNLISRDKKKYN